MKLLALETATEACSCALRVDGREYALCEMTPRRHGERILEMIATLLREAGCGLHELDGIAFGRGPGAFTGVRIAAGVAQGLALGAGLPVAPVSSLNALAQGAFRERGAQRVLTALDARMGEVYWGAFVLAEAGLMWPLVEECVCTPEHVPQPAGSWGQNEWLGVGSGWGVHGEVLRRALRAAGIGLSGEQPERHPHALDVATLGAAILARGGGLPAEAALPVYLRDRVVREK